MEESDEAINAPSGRLRRRRSQGLSLNITVRAVSPFRSVDL